jgi:hypothetical protein
MPKELAGSLTSDAVAERKPSEKKQLDKNKKNDTVAVVSTK